VVLVSRATPADYLSYLDRRGINHLSAGEDRVDLADALPRLATELGIGSIRTDAGGALNGALLAADLVDRIAVIVAPTIGADPTAQTLFRLPRPLTGGVTLHLIESETLDGGALSLVYQVRRGIRAAPVTLLQP
jgi:2,5-diamino-6-(ribosylamino)-4(3H)-pyrimidinone 5'-phosphate reductase